MVRIKYKIRSKVKGKLVPIYMNYQDTISPFRIKTDFKVKQEYWNAAKDLKITREYVNGITDQFFNQIPETYGINFKGSTAIKPDFR